MTIQINGVDANSTTLAELRQDLGIADSVSISRRRIAIGVIGQSNELGAVPDSDLGAFPQAFRSLSRPEIRGSLSQTGVTVGRGSWWYKVMDDLWDWGYDAKIINGAIGSMSMVRNAAGQMAFRNNSSAYYRQRAGAGYSDRGYMGDTICPNGNRVFRCTAGRDIAALGSGPGRNIGSAATFVDYMNFVGSQNSAASSPDFTTANVGDVITDGGISWTCENLNNGAYGGAGGTIFTESQAGLGFDPFGLLQRLHERMLDVQADRKIIYIQNAQSDTFAIEAWYQAALTSVANFFLNRGYEVMIGLSCYLATGNNVSIYNTLQTARNSAITALQAGANGSRVYSGANLYALMGTTGPMGAWGGTAAISSNVMTVSASTYGNIEVGQRITNTSSFALLGTVASLGTWNGTTGTVNLTGGVNTASTGMTGTGQFWDTASGNRNVHLNGAGSVGPAVGGISCAGKYVADALKAILSQRQVVN